MEYRIREKGFLGDYLNNVLTDVIWGPFLNYNKVALPRHEDNMAGFPTLNKQERMKNAPFSPFATKCQAHWTQINK